MTSRPALAQHRPDLARLRRVRDRIDREYAQPLDVEALASGVHMSAGHLSREFRLAYGESPYGYLMMRRIERAMALLRGGDLSVTEVCFAVGYSSLGTFSSRFTDLVGMPPSTYWRLAAGATPGMPSCSTVLIPWVHLQQALHRPGRYAAQQLPAPRGARDGGDAVVGGEASDQTDQESRSAGHRAAVKVTARDITTTTLGVTMTDSSTQGIKTVLHPVSDLAAAKAVYAALLGVPPQSDAPYYVGFEAAGQQIGLVPGGGPQGMTSPVAFWHVSDIEAKLAEVMAAGATLKEAAHDVGGGRLVATFTDPDGNVLGLVQDQ